MVEEHSESAIFAICNNVLKLEVEKGHLNWSLSAVARAAGVSRSLIYYYFGKEKDVILNESMRYMLKVFYEKQDPNEPIHSRMSRVLETMSQMPYAFVLYFLSRKNGSEFFEEIENAENKHLSHLQKEFPSLSDNERLRIYLQQLGAIVYGLDPAKVETVFSKS